MHSLLGFDLVGNSDVCFHPWLFLGALPLPFHAGFDDHFDDTQIALRDTQRDFTRNTGGRL
jgi:hypothetical protein